MSNLLDKASIILTPTAYNNGEALCVKPSDGSGDFDFSRNSAATRVNAQGLVENVQILSSNLVQNGDFSEEGVEEVSNGSFSQEGSELITNGDFSVSGTPNTSSWALGWYSNTNNVEIANGKLTLSNSAIESASRAYATNGVNSNNILTTNKFYKLQYDIVENNGATDLKYYSANGSFISVPSVDVGSYTLYIQNTSNSLFLFQLVTSNSSISIDNVSVREVGQNWTLGTGWSIAEDKAVCDGTNNADITQVGSIVGKTYKATLSVSENNVGRVNVYIGGTFAGQTTNGATGDFTFYATATDTNLIRIRSNNSFNGSITNISVKEVGQNWVLGDGWYIGNNLINIDTSLGVENLQQANVFTIGKKYKITLDANITSGSVKFESGSGSNLVITSSDTNVEHIFEADLVNIVFRRNVVGTQGTITNISVIEITDDTNLPRINYEGFSYQDALGSELNPNTYIADKSANLTLNGTQLQIDNGGENYARARANVVLVSGKTYRAKVTCINQGTNGASFYVLSARPFGTINMISGETYEVTFVADSFYTPFYENKVGGSGLIVDNISIKEYLGQEVVPGSGCGSWLFEPQSTNLIEYSNDYADAYWIKATSGSGIAPIVTSNYAISPDGTQNADRIQFDATTSGSNSDRSRIRTTLTLSDVTDYTFSFYAKSTDGTDQKIGILFDNSQISVKTITSEWQRFEGTAQQFGTSSICGLDLRGGVASTSDILVYGIQIEQQSYATSYIPTSGSTVTRNQDLCTNGGSLASINSTEGTLYFEGSFIDGGRLALSTADDSDQVVIGFTSSVFYRIKENNVNIITNFFTSANELNRVYKIAVKYQSGNCSIFVDGIKETDTNTFSLSSLSKIQFVSEGQEFFGKTKCLAVWKEALSDAELTELTTI